MKKEFIPYEQALALKKLGFDESCFRQYYNDNNGIGLTNGCVSNPKNSDIKSYYKYRNKHCSAPLYQQAFDWFRFRYNINPQIAFCEYSIQSCNGWSFTITNPTKRQNWIGKYKSYEEAKLECLKFLITKITNEESNI